MKILQNETTNNSPTTSAPTTTISKEKHQQQDLQYQHQQHFAEKRKAKTLKNKILQNVAQQHHEQQQQQQQEQEQKQDASVNNNSYDKPSAMTDEPTNVKNSNNNSSPEYKSAPKITRNLLKDSSRESSSGSSNNKNNNINNNNNNSDLIIAEAAKILLKNGLNGTNAAAAAAVATATATLLTAAANFHNLPIVTHNTSAANSNLIISTSATTSIPASSLTSSVSNSSALATNTTTAAAAAHAQLVAIAAAAAAVNATNHKRLATTPSSLTTPTSSSSSTSSCKSPNQNKNNGLLCNSAIQTTTTSTTISSVSTVAVATTTHFTKPYKTNSSKTTMSSSPMDMGIIDYTLNSNNSSTATTLSSSSVINLSTSTNNFHHTTAHQKFLSNNSINSHSNHSDIGRLPISHQTPNINNNKNALSGDVGGGGSGMGGRLQFFKDGKFILELARSKDGEKGGWVSVPRKLFRTPSAATSSTVTPSATALTSAAVLHSPLTASAGAVVAGTSYPKNECSNSLSFSDDNSSIQSSPWQRDHCWKQLAPKKNVSKELTLFYRRPVYYKLTTQAVLLLHRKRRKPYDTKTLDNGLIFGLKSKKEKQHQQHQADISITNQKELETKEGIDNRTDVDKNKEEGDAKDIKSTISVYGTKTKVDEDENTRAKEEKVESECDKSCDNIYVIKTEVTIKTDDDNIDVEMSKISSPRKKEENPIKSSNTFGETKIEKSEAEKKNTSDYANEETISKHSNSNSLNGDVSNEDLYSKEKHKNALEVQVNKRTTGEQEKRLKKNEHYKTRAKLITIVQKLIDASTSRLAVTAHSFKTSNQTTTSQATSLTFTASSASSSSLAGANLSSGSCKNSKLSPPSNTAASRLVEYHQQHVSPRKRILREFEKVSLEDNATGASGGKRSRPKTSSANLSPSTLNLNVTSSSITTSSKSISFNTHNSNLGNIPKSTAASIISNAPTKLYSSYSIHSLLGGSLSSSPSSSSSNVLAPATKRTTDMTATINSSSMPTYLSYNSTSFPSNSPKSPEGNIIAGGKSPSNSATKTRRSPPYNSPMRETHSRSPISSGIVGYNDYGGRRSPKSTPDIAHNVFNKMRYVNSVGTDSTASSTNHHLHQHQQNHIHQQQNYHHQSQTYYSPYMMSPHYVPPLSGPSALSPNALSANTPSSSTTNSRSPRHHASAFRATTPTLVSSTSTTHNIPGTQKGDLSPQRSTTASPRETTPRTVPKKTASIRRQFASPTSATQNHSSSNCSSPIMTLDSRNDDNLNNDRRTPVNSNISHQQHQQPQHLMQRGSPGNPNITGSPIHPYSYMYTQPPSSGNSPHTSNAAGSNLPSSVISSSTANVSVAAAAAAAVSYIPTVVGSPYYHPYISTLAAMRHPQMWMQHYQSAVAAVANPTLMQARHPAMLSAVAARLSPTYHGFQYNGVGNAAALAAAAAAAAAGFGSASNPPHPSNALSHPNSLFNPMANSTLHGIQHSTTALQVAGLVPASAVTSTLTAVTPMTDTTDLLKASKNNFSSSSPLLSTVGSGGMGLSGLSSSTGSSGSSIYTISNKDEHSSDVPLNLSKH